MSLLHPKPLNLHPTTNTLKGLNPKPRNLYVKCPKPLNLIPKPKTLKGLNPKSRNLYINVLNPYTKTLTLNPKLPQPKP